MTARPTDICTDLSSQELRRLARNETKRRAAMHMLATTNALDGIDRQEAARLADMSDQALRDAIKRYNAEGTRGLFDHPLPGRPGRLDADQESKLIQIVIDDPDIEKNGLSSFTRGDLVKIVHDKWKVPYHPSSMGRASCFARLDTTRRLDLSRQKARPSNPKKDPAAAVY